MLPFWPQGQNRWMMSIRRPTAALWSSWNWFVQNPLGQQPPRRWRPRRRAWPGGERGVGVRVGVGSPLGVAEVADRGVQVALAVAGAVGARC